MAGSGSLFYSVCIFAVFFKLGDRFNSGDGGKISFYGSSILDNGYHYGASAATFLGFAAILATANILNWRWVKKIRLSDNLKAGYIGLILVVLTFIFKGLNTPQLAAPLGMRMKAHLKKELAHRDAPRLAAGQFTFSFRNPADPFYRFFNLDQIKFRFPANYQESIKLIPPDKSLTAQMTLGTALGHRNEIYWWSDYPNQKKGDIILLEKDFKNGQPLSEEMEKCLKTER